MQFFTSVIFDNVKDHADFTSLYIAGQELGTVVASNVPVRPRPVTKLRKWLQKCLEEENS